MKKKLIAFLGCLILVFGLAMVLNFDNGIIAFGANTVKGATITPESKPYKNYHKDSSGKYKNKYNSQRKHTYLINSYLKAFEAKGGGTLHLTKSAKKNTFYISNEICIPSNTTIVIHDGVTVKKTYDAGKTRDGKTKLTPSVYMFSFVRLSLGGSRVIKRGESISKTNATVKSTIEGRGSATIDAGGVGTYSSKNPMCGTIAFGDNYNCRVKGITFKNMNNTYGHYMEVSGTKDCVIENNIFIQSKSKPQSHNGEAINVDTCDKIKGGFSGKWLVKDGTRNVNLKIRNNKFENMNVAIGTHGYTYGNPHKGTQIYNNTFTNVQKMAIQPMNWKETKIYKNSFNCSTTSPMINCRGVNLMSVYGNTFKVNNPNTRIYYFRYAYHQSGEKAKLNVKPVGNSLTANNEKDILQNNTYTGSYHKKIYFRAKPVKSSSGVYQDPKDTAGNWKYDKILTLD